MKKSATFTPLAADPATIASTIVYMSKERFEEADPDLANRGSYKSILIGDTVFKVRNHADLAHCGFNYSITLGGAVFKVRNYDALPGSFTVISPADAKTLPQARQLVDHLLSEFGFCEVDFYDRASDRYRKVDLQTLEFLTFGF
jgi:hypothetical protein